MGLFLGCEKPLLSMGRASQKGAPLPSALHTGLKDKDRGTPLEYTDSAHAHSSDLKPPWCHPKTDFCREELGSVLACAAEFAATSVRCLAPRDQELS